MKLACARVEAEADLFASALNAVGVEVTGSEPKQTKHARGSLRKLLMAYPYPDAPPEVGTQHQSDAAKQEQAVGAVPQTLPMPHQPAVPPSAGSECAGPAVTNLPLATKVPPLAFPKGSRGDTVSDKSTGGQAASWRGRESRATTGVDESGHGGSRPAKECSTANGVGGHTGSAVRRLPRSRPSTAGVNRKPYTRNPKPETRNPKPRTPVCEHTCAA
jgi:hypothetical protein